MRSLRFGCSRPKVEIEGAEYELNVSSLAFTIAQERLSSRLRAVAAGEIPDYETLIPEYAAFFDAALGQGIYREILPEEGDELDYLKYNQLYIFLSGAATEFASERARETLRQYSHERAERAEAR